MTARYQVDLDNVQGNVIPGFLADYQTLLALRIDDADAARTWLNLVADETTTARTVLTDRENGSFDRPWLNVALSHDGLARLVDPELTPDDEAFRSGLAARSALLGDAGSPADWEVGGSDEKALHVLVIVAGAAEDAVRNKVDQVALEASGSGLVKVWGERSERIGPKGRERKQSHGRHRAREHFGFLDGISGPAVRGVDGSRARTFYLNADGPEYAAPGTPLVHAGSFVFGYPKQNPNDLVAMGDPASAGHEWTRDGSYLVFRRLRQDVDGFWAFVRDNAERVKAEMGWTTSEPDEALAAFLVGRWRDSGRPVVRTATRDAAAPGNDPGPAMETTGEEINDFDFGNHPTPGGDPLGLACPASAHIRKVNPRAGFTDQGGAEDTLTRRILRRGMPYGTGEDDDRGLHFLCYQTSIVDQFEFLSIIWSNSPAAPRGSGMDLVTGQGRGTRTAFLPSRTGRQVAVSTDRSFVHATGGEYLFAPSIEGLRAIADNRI